MKRVNSGSPLPLRRNLRSQFHVGDASQSVHPWKVSDLSLESASLHSYQNISSRPVEGMHGQVYLGLKLISVPAYLPRLLFSLSFWLFWIHSCQIGSAFKKISTFFNPGVFVFVFTVLEEQWFRIFSLCWRWSSISILSKQSLKAEVIYEQIYFITALNAVVAPYSSGSALLKRPWFCLLPSCLHHAWLSEINSFKNYLLNTSLYHDAKCWKIQAR